MNCCTCNILCFFKEVLLKGASARAVAAGNRLSDLLLSLAQTMLFWWLLLAQTMLFWWFIKGTAEHLCLSQCRPRKPKGIRQMPSGLPLTQALDQISFHEIPETDLDSIHTISWERDIIWADPDELHDPVAELNSHRQKGNDGPGQEDDWDLDQALGMDLDPPSAKSHVCQRPVPFLEPLPHHKDTGGFVC